MNKLRVNNTINFRYRINFKVIMLMMINIKNKWTSKEISMTKWNNKNYLMTILKIKMKLNKKIKWNYLKIKIKNLDSISQNKNRFITPYFNKILYMNKTSKNQFIMMKNMKEDTAFKARILNILICKYI